MSTTTAQVFLLPDLGEGLTEAGLVQWLVTVGDTVRTDQPIAEVETAKSVVELPSPFAGVVVALHATPGDSIAVGGPVLEVADAGSVTADARHADEEPREDSASAGAAPAHDAYRQEERAGSGNVLIGYGTGEGTPRRHRRRPSAVGDGDGPATRPTEALPSPASDGQRRPVAVRSPLVRRLARDLGLDVHAIVPTGPDGAVTRADVLRAAVDDAVTATGARSGAASPATGAASPVAEAASASSGADELGILSRERLSPLRRAVAAKLSRSRAEIPEATVWVDVDATELGELRARMAPEGGRAPSITALVARFALLALEEYPVLASRLSDDGEELISFDGVNLGIAADTARGLMVPVIPRAHALSIDQLDDALRELTETARSGSMPPERLRGSTFTLNNYGGLGVDGSAAIINHPEVAILGIGRIIPRAWVVDGDVIPRRIAQLSLVFDHRVCDGGYAAGFLRRITELIEHPLRAFGRIR